MKESKDLVKIDENEPVIKGGLLSMLDEILKNLEATNENLENTLENAKKLNADLAKTNRFLENTSSNFDKKINNNILNIIVINGGNNDRY